MSDDRGLDADVAGYRVVRRLGSGSRADVFLGAGTTGTVALKVFHPSVSTVSIGTELDALSRLDSPHLVRLVDLGSSPDDVPIPILERIARGSLVSLLRDRDWLEPGEVVTVLEPISEVIRELHQRGIGHQGIEANAVHFGSAGEPVLLGFGHCELFAAGGSIAAIDAEPAAARDREDLAALAVMLLSRVRGAASDQRTVGLIEWIDSAPREFEFPERLAARLFDFADPLAIDFGREERPGSAVPARIRFSDRASTMLPVSTPAPAIEPSPARPSGVLGLIGTVLHENPFDAVQSRALAAAKSVRKPFWYIAAAVVLAFIVVAAALPASSPHPVAAQPSTKSPPTAAPTRTSSPLPADPVLALPLLLAARNACVRAMSVLCLNDVDEASSSAYSDDAALVEQLQGGSEIPKTAIVTASGATLVELLGNSAIVRLGPSSNPASVLMIKDEAGWRIRGYLSGVQATGSPQTTDSGPGG